MKIEKRLPALTACLVVSLSSWMCAQEKQPAASAPAAAEVPEGSIEVLRLALCKNVADREPDQEITSAALGDVVTGWIQVRSGLGEVTLTHRWLHEGENMGDVPLVVRSSPFRTWSRKTMGATGKWTLQVLDPQGAVLKEASLTVTAAPPVASPQ
ncbi:MAG: hypothetical protein A2992_04455 [Elusimicrobia bacterium RIFCSPLOWO2_01_FULL_59_12]|nr:MAG: hypothetical protein A2992_04455 [Elusimicrobia bacterium RIFCSPLOWO2_01_FULL_59_12]